MTPTFSICIAHAAGRPERERTLARLVERLNGHRYALEARPGKPREYIDWQWSTALNFPGTHCVLLNDDVVPCENFIPTLTKAVEARPNEIIALTNHDQGASVADSKSLRWLVSVDMLVGQAYVVPRHDLLAIREWMAEHLVTVRRELDPNHPYYLSEEHILVLYALCHDRRIWHTVPALVDQADEKEAPSLFGHDGDWARHPVVAPRSPMPTDWDTDAIQIGSRVPHVLRQLLINVRGESWKQYRTVEKYYAMYHGTNGGDVSRSTDQ